MFVRENDIFSISDLVGFIQLEFIRLLILKNYYPLHGAAVAFKDRKGILIIGDTNSGKTTMAVALLRNRDFKFLCDDKIILTLNKGDSINVLAFPEYVGIRPHTFCLLPELSSLNDDIKYHDKTLVNIQTLYGAKIAKYATPCVILKSNLNNISKECILPESKAETYKYLLNQIFSTSKFLNLPMYVIVQYLKVIETLLDKVHVFSIYPKDNLYHSTDILNDMIVSDSFNNSNNF